MRPKAPQGRAVDALPPPLSQKRRYFVLNLDWRLPWILYLIGGAV